MASRNGRRPEVAREDVLFCRTFHHGWEIIPKSLAANTRALGPGWAPVGALEVFLRCARCTTIRGDAWTPDGQLAHRSYWYPAGYSLELTGEGTRGQKLRTMIMAETTLVRPRRQRRKTS